MKQSVCVTTVDYFSVTLNIIWSTRKTYIAIYDTETPDVIYGQTGGMHTQKILKIKSVLKKHNLFQYSNKKDTFDFHGTVSFDPIKMFQQKKYQNVSQTHTKNGNYLILSSYLEELLNLK